MELIIGIIIIILVVVLPVHIAGKMVDAQRTGFGWCFLALILSSIFQVVGQSISLYGFILSPLLSALAYSLVMKTTYLKGIGIAILHYVLTFIIATLLVTFSFASLAVFAFPY